MIQNSFTTNSCFSAALSYEPQRRITSAFIHGLSEKELDKLTAQLIANKELLGLPMLLPYLLLAARGTSATSKIRECHRQIVETEAQTGVKTNWHPNNSCCSTHHGLNVSSQDNPSIDFDLVTRCLTSLSSKLAYCEYICDVHLPMLDKIDKINYTTLAAAPERHRKRLENQVHQIRIYINLLRNSLTGSRFRAEYLSKRARAQVRNVDLLRLLLLIAANIV